MQRFPEVQLTLLLSMPLALSLGPAWECAGPDNETAEPWHIVMQLAVCKGGS